MRLYGNYALREYGGKQYAIAIGEAAKNFKGMLELNEIGAFIFKALDKQTSEKSISDAIVSRYDADRNVVAADVRNFILKLKAANIIAD